MTAAPRYTAREFLLTYMSWQAMLQRCVYRGKRRKDAKFYRSAGVVVCQRWLSFENFISDMGARPSKELSLDRFPDKSGNYEPGNCRWATARQQAANTRQARILEHAGEALPIAEWARRTGIKRSTIQFRLDAGKSVADALSLRHL